jgi:hypothetical protein
MSLPDDESRVSTLAFRLANTSGSKAWAWYTLTLAAMALTVYLRFQSAMEYALFGCLFVVVFAIIHTRSRRRKRNHVPTQMVLDVATDGISFSTQGTVMQLDWNEIRDVLQIDEYSAIRTTRAGLALFVPDRAFGSLADRHEWHALIQSQCGSSAPAVSSAVLPTPSRLHFTYSWLDFFSAARASWFPRGMVILVFAVVAWQAIVGAGEARGSIRSFVLFMLVAGLLMYLAISAVLASQNWYKCRQAGGLSYSLTYDNQALEIEGGGTCSNAPWSNLKRYTTTGRCYIVWSSPLRGGVLIPRSVFSSRTDEARFETVLQGKLRRSAWYLF